MDDFLPAAKKIALVIVVLIIPSFLEETSDFDYLYEYSKSLFYKEMFFAWVNFCLKGILVIIAVFVVLYLLGFIEIKDIK